LTDLDKALDIATQVAPFTHIFEVGTLLIYAHGAQAIKRFKLQFPNKPILADTKLVDRGKDAATIFAHAGADWITVMAGTSKNVIYSICTTAHNLNMKVMLDLLDACSIAQSALEAKNLGIDALLFHQPSDDKELFVLADQWEMIKGNTTLPIFISAKIKRETIDDILNIGPDGIIVGKSIIDAEDPQKEAQFFFELCTKNG
jgi:3-hexulose-6-phosphate synthase